MKGFTEVTRQTFNNILNNDVNRYVNTGREAKDLDTWCSQYLFIYDSQLRETCAYIEQGLGGETLAYHIKNNRINESNKYRKE